MLPDFFCRLTDPSVLEFFAARSLEVLFSFYSSNYGFNFDEGAGKGGWMGVSLS